MFEDANDDDDDDDAISLSSSCLHSLSVSFRSFHSRIVSFFVCVCFFLVGFVAFIRDACSCSICMRVYVFDMYMRVQHQLHQSVSDRLHRVGRRMTAAPAARRWCVSCPLSCFSLLPHTHTHTYPHTHRERERERCTRTQTYRFTSRLRSGRPTPRRAVR